MGIKTVQGDVPRLLIDTNVVLDKLRKREPFVSQAARLWQRYDTGSVRLYLPASVLTDIFYIVRGQTKDIALANDAVDGCLEIFTIISVDRAILEHARKQPGNDFEDNVLIACAEAEQVTAIVTRDVAGFRHSRIPVSDPSDI